MTNLHTFFAKVGEEETTRRLFLQCFAAWTNRDLEGALSCMSEDVAHILNLDGTLVPYGASVEGKPALRKKLQLLLDTFEFGALVNESLSVEGRKATGRYKFIYIHCASGERLSGSFRFIIEQRDGLIVRMEEYHDAAYVEAFVRLVSMPRN
ncbi:MAG: nuclear transport factor 2 family protein [Hyphomicrobiaceae bacterium]